MPTRTPSLIDIHCHLIPGIDDGAETWDDTLAMARMAVTDGLRDVIVTPHQLGMFFQNDAVRIRRETRRLAEFLRSHQIPLRVLPGADVRVEAELVAKIRSDEVLTLADRRKHVLLELPHELYFPLQPVLRQLRGAGIVGILSHPERNRGLLANRELLIELVREGCLTQVTAGSLVGTFGAAPREMAEWMLSRRLVHFVATDAHGPTQRRPLLSRAFLRVVEQTDYPTALALFSTNPAAVVAGADVDTDALSPHDGQRRGWFPRTKAG